MSNGKMTNGKLSVAQTGDVKGPEMKGREIKSKLNVKYEARTVPNSIFNFRQEEKASDERSTVAKLWEAVNKDYSTVALNTLTLIGRNLGEHAEKWAAEHYNNDLDRDAAAKVIVEENQAGYWGAIERLKKDHDIETISDMIRNGSVEEKRVAMCVAGTVLHSKFIDAFLVVIKRELESDDKDTAVLRQAINTLGNYKRLGDEAKCELICERMRGAFEHRDADVRATALNTVRKVLDVERIGMLEEDIKPLMKDKDAGVRMKAVVALSVSNSEETEKSILELLPKEKDADVAGAMFLTAEMICARRGGNCEENAKATNDKIRDKKYDEGDNERLSGIRVKILARLGEEIEPKQVLSAIVEDLRTLQIEKFKLRKEDLRTPVKVDEIIRTEQYNRHVESILKRGH